VKLDKDGNPKMKNMGELTDPAQVAAFIRTMVDKQVDLPEKQEDGSILLRPARWKDFLVLTRTKGNIRSYAAALTALDIPVNVTGEQRLGSVGAVRRGVLHLQAMVENWNDLALVQVLRECYRIPLEEIRVFLQRTGLPSLRAALTGERLEAIHAALKEEKTPDEGMLKLCAALQELAQLRQMPARMPAMSVIERLMDGGFGIWDAGGDEVARRREYARVQQYLELVRAGGRHSFAALAEHAIRCAEQSVKYELPLREENDQVRIMNLHQAKGLEGSVVILAYSTKGTDRIYRHVSRQGTAKEYACVLSKGGIQASVLGWPEEWNGENLPGRGSEKLTEKAYLDAEKLRLQYVAVTRAAYWLVVCGEAEKWDMKGGKAVCSTVDTGWSRITNGGAIPTLAKVEEGISDPGLKAALQSLSKGQCAYVRAGAGGGVTQVSPQTLETALDGSAAECAEADSYAITPSKLDHASRSASLRKDRADGQGNGAQTAPQQGGDIPSNEPRGADWGTIVHRIMELAVRSGQYDPAALETFARQAVEETLPDGVLTKEQRRQLLGGAGQSDPGDYLARRAAQAAGFLSDPKSCLRRLMDGSACYPELPFILTEADRSSDLYRHVSAHIGDEQAQGKTLELQGILDLAIRRQDGSWMVVDYKTDRLHAGETPAQLEARLRQEYTAQILSYVRILERLNMGAVTGAYLCSVPLGGKLVELPLQEGVRCPVSVLRPDGRGYDPCIAQAGGAHGFSLLLDGKEVTLTDSRGNTGTQFKMCRRFAEGVSLWLKERYPAADCSVDMTNAGSVVVLKRLLNTMKRVLPADEWKRLEIRWNT